MIIAATVFDGIQRQLGIEKAAEVRQCGGGWRQWVWSLSLGRYLDQQHRRKAGPEFVADRAMVLMLLEVILFYKLNFYF